MKKEAILEVLEDWNCWSKPFKKSFKRKSYEDEIAKKGVTGEIIFLTGVRRSGKSTILQNYIKNLIAKGVNVCKFRRPPFCSVSIFRFA